MASLVRFVHAAQARLDVPVSGFYDTTGTLSSAARVTLEDASLDAFDCLIENTRQAGVDALLLAGNTLRAADRSIRARHHLEQGLARLDEVGIATIIATGPLDPPQAYKLLAMPDSAALLSPRDPRHSIRPQRAEIEFVLGDEGDFETHGLEDRADVQIAVVPPDRDVELIAATGDRGSRRFDPPHDIGRAPGVAYWALGAGIPSSTTLKSGLAHDPGPLCPPSARFTGPCGATLVEIDSNGSVRTTAMPCSPILCETVVLPITGILSLESLAETMQSRLAGIHRGEELTVVTWKLAGHGALSSALRKPSTWADVVSLADDSHGSRVHLLSFEPAAQAIDDVAAMLAEEFQEIVIADDPDPRDQIDVNSPEIEQLLQAAAVSPITRKRVQELGAAVFSADCDELWKAA